MYICIFFSLLCNFNFWAALFDAQSIITTNIYAFILLTFVVITTFQWFVLLVVSYHPLVKVMLSLILFTTSIVVYFMNTFHVYIDPSMIENVFSTDHQEALALVQWRMLLYVFFWGFIPISVLSVLQFYKIKLLKRLIYILAALTTFLLTLWLGYPEYASLSKSKPELAYLITPLNYFRATISVVKHRHKLALKKTIGRDAHQLAIKKPRVIIMVVGETVRANNWGLNGYKRQTTPLLSNHDVINFKHVSSCGTNTATSLPCMFSPLGVHSYNKNEIENSESLLHVLSRAKISVLWRDNQSGCKGVCSDLAYEPVNTDKLCKNDRCFDESLVWGLQDIINHKKGSQFIVLHMNGNHGPDYFKRYPDSFRHWQPTCDTGDLAVCSRKSIINTYDNAILYTDSILARLITDLSKISSHDTGLVYVSDHGESLGEYNLWLHGLPYWVAPEVQKKVPMILWLSSGLAESLGVDWQCMHQKESELISHDYLFSSLLTMSGVKTELYDSGYDLLSSCRARD